ncbi:hypothetical protein ABII15_10000 [Streptomyces sp. HUAS MG91]|uniref:Lipoprotein n=1 Tax=Streptomyces tabacisoli TaxID=3156398 RepID=A0AAU8IQU1_9ACTN
MVAGISVTGLAACGGGDDGDDAFKGDSADKIADKAVAATKAAESLHMKGKVSQSGGESMVIDLAVDQEKNCQGTVTMSGAKAEVRHVKATFYLKGDEQYWRTSLKQQPGADKIVPKVADKWVKMPAQDNQITGLCDKQGLLAAMDEDKSERKGLKKGDTSTIDGTKALALHKSKGDEKSTLYVATEGKPYILKVTTTGGSEPETTTFSDYDKPVKPEQPAAGDTVDLKQLAAQ